MDHSKILYHNHIAIYPNAAPDEFCDALINNFKEYQDEPQLQRNRLLPDAIDIIVKDTAVGYSSVKKEYIDFLFTDIMFKKLIPLYTRKYTGFEVLFREFNIKFDGFNIQKTEPGEGYHTWHAEWAPAVNAFQRSLVWTLYLNDVEEGGETEFLDVPFRLKPKKGTLCLFPASTTHFHRGNPPISGTKFIATGWIETVSPIFKDLFNLPQVQSHLNQK